MTNTIYVSGFIFISFSFGRIVIFDLVSFGTPLGLPSVQRSVVAFKEKFTNEIQKNQ